MNKYLLILALGLIACNETTLETNDNITEINSEETEPKQFTEFFEFSNDSNFTFCDFYENLERKIPSNFIERYGLDQKFQLLKENFYLTDKILKDTSLRSVYPLKYWTRGEFKIFTYLEAYGNNETEYYITDVNVLILDNSDNIIVNQFFAGSFTEEGENIICSNLRINKDNIKIETGTEGSENISNKLELKKHETIYFDSHNQLISWIITDTSLYDSSIIDASFLHLQAGDKVLKIHSSFSTHTTPKKLFSFEEIIALQNGSHNFSEIIPTTIISGTYGFHAGLSEGFYVILNEENNYEVFCFYLDEDMKNYKKESVLVYELNA